jgi:hypothetical protein
MTATPVHHRMGHRLIQLGVFLFLLGLLGGFAIPFLANPRMGLASHLEGVMNGMLLVLLGLIWPRLTLRQGVLSPDHRRGPGPVGAPRVGTASAHGARDPAVSGDPGAAGTGGVSLRWLCPAIMQVLHRR